MLKLLKCTWLCLSFRRNKVITWLVCFLGKSFRHEQCEAKNGYQSDAKGVKTFVEWVPKYAGVLLGDVCKLTCRAKGTGYYVVFSPKVTAHRLSRNSKRPRQKLFGRIKPRDTKYQLSLFIGWLSFGGFYFHLCSVFVCKTYMKNKKYPVNKTS